MVNNLVFISLGTNLGNRAQNLEIALEKLLKFVNVIKKSKIYETKPIDYKNQPLFLNMVVKIETKLSARELITKLQEVENEMGRIKKIKKGPRIIDLDILYYNNEIINEPNLKIPHPRAYKRNFVLTPLKELAPDLMDPKKHKTITQLLYGLKKN
ncbi:MAG: 2-amino-4-hydroxy-6-hydroxymethyldihydropteridine diphosphokinase [Patescibacteria group bacterium]